MKNKRGEIPITILVLGIFAICALALISFVVSDYKFFKSSFDISLIESVHADVEKFHFYVNYGDSELVAANKINARIDLGNLVVEKGNEFMEIKFTES